MTHVSFYTFPLNSKQMYKCTVIRSNVVCRYTEVKLVCMYALGLFSSGSVEFPSTRNMLNPPGWAFKDGFEHIFFWQTFQM